MTTKGPSLSVAILGDIAVIKVPGRANYDSSLELRNVVGALRCRGFDDFVLDLHECITMDSTFLGVLAGLVLKNNQPAGVDGAAIELLNANARVLELVENLGVLDMFRVTQQNGNAPTPLKFEMAENGPAPTKEDITRNCLQAHETLMKINPANIPKFKDVTQFMAEDLKKICAEKKAPDSSNGAPSDSR